MIKGMVAGPSGRSFPWWGFIILGWVVLQAFSWYLKTVPVETVFRAGNVWIADTDQGECSTMTYDRDIHARFEGDFKVKLLRQDAATDLYYEYRTYTGHTAYVPDSILPPGPKLHMGWWTWLGATDERFTCPWPAGEYRALTVWTVHMPDGGGTREVERLSNEFTINP